MGGGFGPGAILAIDTAGPAVGAATWAEGRCWGRWSARVVRGADAALLPAVQDLLDALPVPLVRVAVSVGPGAFTGLRVGVATALGVAVSRDVPVVPLSSLWCRAALVPDTPVVLALLDARKGRVYAGLYDTTAGVPRALCPERDAPLDAVLPRGDFVAVGEGAAVMADAVRAAGGRIDEDPARSPVAAVAALAGREDLPAVDAGTVALRYLRTADAVPPAGLGVRSGARTDS